MPDYKDLYFKLFRATAAAVDLLIAAQRDCEELVLSDADGEIFQLPGSGPPDPPRSE